MTRIRFEDLPSRNTPRNADNLNKLNNVVISPTEPTTGEEVWIKKSDNLFDVNTPVNTSYLNTNGEFVESTDKFLFINQKIKVTGTITFSWSAVNTTPTIRIAQYKADGTFISKPNIFPYEQTSPVTINLDSNTDYIIVSVEHNNIDKVLDLQIVKGDNELPYTPYVAKEIYVKNDNGVYELFNKVEEHQYCQVQISGNRILSFSGTQYERVAIPFDKIVTKNGDFSLEENGIKIGKGISKIRVTFNLMLNEISTETAYTIEVRVSETTKAFSYLKLRTLDAISHTWVIDVKENDNVSLTLQNQGVVSNSIKFYGTSAFPTTSMLIEKIA